MTSDTKKHQCDYCSFSSDRKYNRDTHENRIHRNKKSNKSYQFPNLEKSSHTMSNPAIQSSLSSFSESSFPTMPFTVNLNSDEINNKIKREKERNFNRTKSKFLYNYLKPLLTSRYQGNNVRTPTNMSFIIAPPQLPKAFKLYKCNNCQGPIFEALDDFQSINAKKEYNHQCLNQLQSNSNVLTMLRRQFQELLLSVIDIRLASKNILLKMMVFPSEFIENSLSPLLMEILSNTLLILTRNSNEYPVFEIFKLSHILKLLKNEKFVDLGEINFHHWAKRAHDSINGAKLEKEELKQFVNITNGTFSLIKFKIQDKTIYALSYVPLI